DSGLGTGRDAVPRRLVLAVAPGMGTACTRAWRDPGRWHALAAAQDKRFVVLVPVVPRHLPALPLRSNHASRLEDLHPGYLGVDLRRRRGDVPHPMRLPVPLTR